MQQMVNESIAAEIMDVAVQTLRNWRHLRKGPAYLKLEGRSVRYSLEDLKAYLNRHRVDPNKAMSSKSD